MKQAIILGNIITMDEKRPFAKAALVKNGVFAYIGNAEEAKSSLVQTLRCWITVRTASIPDSLSRTVTAIWLATALSDRPAWGRWV